MDGARAAICYDRPVKRLAAFVFAALAAHAADAFYIGTWKIDSAMVAPWWTEKTKPDAREMNGLVGKTFTIGAKSITGPRQVACANPHYEVKDYTADMLFQGMFGEMHERDNSKDPAKAAASVGFKGSKWKVLETGCANEVEFHFIDPSTAAVGLNNYIYILKKQ